MSNKITKEIILVSGIDYPKFEEDTKTKKRKDNLKSWVIAPPYPLPFQKYCRQWAANSLRKDKKLKISWFDFSSGTRTEISVNSTGNLTYNGKDNYGKPDRNNYRFFLINKEDPNKALLIPFPLIDEPILSEKKPPLDYLRGVSQLGENVVKWEVYFEEYQKFLVAPEKSKLKKEECISITDIYKYILNVGKNNLSKKEQNLVIEIHFFSHSYEEGPILINSKDYIKALNLEREDWQLVSKRNPLDMDCRAKFDFLELAVNRDQFRKAINQKDCKIFIWGCNRNDFIKTLILETIRLSKSSEQFDFSKSVELLTTYKAEYSVYLAIDGKPIKFTTEKVIDLLYENYINNNYVQKISDFFDVSVIAPVPGTYTTNDETGIEKNKFMHAVVPNKKLFEILNFYKKNYIIRGIDIGHGNYYSNFGRGYGIFYGLK